MDWEDFWTFEIFGFELKNLGIIALEITATLILAKLSIWLINQKILSRVYRKKKIDSGRQIALRQFISYIIWSLTVFSILEILGIGNMIWASSAALLVGIGLGLQDTFKDLICGIVILTEGTVEVGDIIELDGTVAIVTSIGLRVSKLETRDRINILVPNSKLVVDSVINWSYKETANRFSVTVGVAYGSDLDKVKSLLLKAADETDNIEKEPLPLAQFRDFGNSSLDFELFFFSKEFFKIEIVKSDLRFAIEKLFRSNNIEIPFPQRDLWIKNAGDFK